MAVPASWAFIGQHGDLGPEIGCAGRRRLGSRRSNDGRLFPRLGHTPVRPETAKPIAEIFERIDGCLPTPAPQCPGGIVPDGRPWAEVERSYAFVDDLARLQPEIVGIGSRERFDYWFKSFCYLKATGRAGLPHRRTGSGDGPGQSQIRPAKKKELAGQVALPLRLQLLDDWGQIVTLLLETVGNWGEIGPAGSHP